MSEHDKIENPGIRLWHDIIAVLMKHPARANQAENSAQIVNNLTATLPDASDIVFRAQRALMDVEALLESSVTDPRRLNPHRRLIDRLKRVFDPRYFSQAWHDYKSSLISEDMLYSLALLDADLAGAPMSLDDIHRVQQDIKRLQEKIKSARLSPSWSELLVGQLDLVDRSIARVNADGFANFREVVFCAVGKLELHLRTDPSEFDGEVAREIVDDLLRIAGLATFGAAAIKAIPFFRWGRRLAAAARCSVRAITPYGRECLLHCVRSFA